MWLYCKFNIFRLLSFWYFFFDLRYSVAEQKTGNSSTAAAAAVAMTTG